LPTHLLCRQHVCINCVCNWCDVLQCVVDARLPAHL